MKQFFVIILFFLLLLSTVILNVQVSNLKSEIINVTKEIDKLELEKSMLENFIQSSLNLKDIERKALKLGLTYPKNIVELRIVNGRLAEISEEKYYASSLNK